MKSCWKKKPPNRKNPRRSRLITLTTHFLAFSRESRPLGRPQQCQKPRGMQKNPPTRGLSAHSAHLLAISRTRISYHDALERTACAPFREERRMKFTEATKSHRKSGGEPRPLRRPSSITSSEERRKIPPRGLITHTTHLLAISRTRISYHDALERTACAPFREERRMKFTEATKSHRKSGGEPRPLGRPQQHHELRGTQKNPPRRKPRAHRAHFLAISRDQVSGTTNRTHLVDSLAADPLSLTAKRRDWLLRGSA